MVRKVAPLGALVLLVAGCSSTPPAPLPMALESSAEKAVVKIDTPSRIVALYKLVAGAKCEKPQTDLTMDVSALSGGARPPTKASCKLVSGHVSVQTEVLPKGEYQVRVRGRADKRRFVGQPLVTADPSDPEALSGPDQDFGGAVDLAENQSAKGVVDAARANKSNWIVMNGAKGNVALLFLPENAADVQARVYTLPKGAKSPQRVGLLDAKRKRHVSGANGPVLVEIVGRRYLGETSYSLTRRDVAKTKTVSVAVVDLYPISGSSSVVLLQGGNVKAGDELRVIGRKGAGKVNLGRCVVTSVSDTQASCKLDAVPAADLVDFRAELVQDGGAT